MYEVSVQEHIDSAHFIKDYQGKCARIHGHTWKIEITLRGLILDDLNILIDFVDVKRMMRVLTEKLDHYVLNEQLKEDNLTAEFLSRWFYEEFLGVLANDSGFKLGVRLARVTIWESPECKVMYSESE